MAADGRADKRLECGAVESGEEDGGRTGREQVAQAGWKYVRVRDDLIFLGLCRNKNELFSAWAVVGLESSERVAVAWYRRTTTESDGVEKIQNGR